jgi:thiol:disulfide interchange protein/DsbC/DsbD-like thiol-disulfide interchange protein
MHRSFATLIVLVVAAWIGSGPAARAAEPKVQAELIARASAVRPGQPIRVGLHQKIAPHWHTYWKNPGDSGEPTRLTWKLPPGFKVSAIKWPIPKALPVGPLMNFGYSDELLLPVTVTPPADLAGSSVTLEANAEWLVCEKICIPESKTVVLTLPVAGPGQAVPPGPNAALFDAVERQLPTSLGWPVRVEAVGGKLKLAVFTKDLDPARVSAVRFFPDTWGAIAHAAPQPLAWTADGFSLTLTRGETAREGVPKLSGVLVLSERLGDRVVRNGFQIAVAGGGAPTAQSEPLAGLGGVSLWQAIVFAILGGMILNLMPCVLPILSLKALALAGHGREGGRAAWLGGGAYLAGVLVSFGLLAAVVLTLRAAGETIGWGFQFQSPSFVIVMAAVFFALALSLSGVFDIGGGIVGAGEGLTHQGGISGSFFTGVLASVAATPCTAPFMGAAVGYALTRPPSELVVVLLSLGLGFALPMVALVMSGAAQRLLPRPGAWMATFKQALAFPLYATTAWLVWVLSLQTGSDGVLAAAVVLIAVGLAAWLFGLGGGGRWLRFGAGVGLAVLAFALAFTQIGGETHGVSEPAHASNASVEGGVNAEPFSAEKVTALRKAGHPVFVNFTAAWCISCKVNERVALRTDGFRDALRRYNVAYLKGDWTTRNDKIGSVLKSFGRAGVPLYLLYPADTNAKPTILPQLLTEAIVLRHFASLDRGTVRPTATGD